MSKAFYWAPLMLKHSSCLQKGGRKTHLHKIVTQNGRG